MTVRQRLHWLTLHGVIRALTTVGARRGDLQGRLIADPAVRANPGEFSEEIRRHGRLARARAAWLTADHGVVHQVLRSDDFAVTSSGNSLPAFLGRIEERLRTRGRIHPLLPPSLLSVEPPEHTRYRKTVSSVFTARAVSALQERIESTAVELIKDLDGESGVVDIVERYCSQLPVTVIGDILGVPEQDRPQILRFGELAAPSLDIGLSWPQFLRVEEGLSSFTKWLTDHIRQLRASPGDDLMSQLIEATDDGTRLDDSELLATAGLVLAAGFETTVNLLGNGIELLLRHPDQLDLLREQPDLWPNAVEEILRLESPVQLTARIAVADSEIAGHPIRTGDAVVLYLAGANRDPEIFPNSHTFDVTRDNAGRHLSFSGGRHFCLGAALARSEGAVGLRTFFDRHPNATLTDGGRRRDTRVLRGWATLPIALA
ncbi:cytochrome P450 [Mycobacterium sp. C3-094]